MAFASGMAAISSVLLSLLKPGDEVIAPPDALRLHANLIANILPRYGVRSKLVDLTQTSGLAHHINERTKVVYFKIRPTPASRSSTLPRCAKSPGRGREGGSRQHAGHSSLPETAGPGSGRRGASATKYQRPRRRRRWRGGGRRRRLRPRAQVRLHVRVRRVMSPFTAWLLLRGLKTLALRMREHGGTLAVAQYLEGIPV